jgi:membrane protein
MMTFVRRVVARLSGIGISRTAASLAFTSLLGVVPLATMAIAFASRFPIFEDWLRALELVFVGYLLPGIGRSLVRETIVGFAEQAARLSAVTILLIGVTAGLVMIQIEEEINAIFGVRRSRPLWRRLLAVVFALTLGPMLAGAGIWAVLWVVMHSVETVPSIGTLVALVASPMPLMLGTATLTLIYRYLPAREVPWLHALAGGVVAALGFVATKAGFTWYVTHLANYRQIYGALAILPVFMLWLYLFWIVVLVGAAIAAAFARDGGRPRNE